jgi:hypothetical protein
VAPAVVVTAGCVYLSREHGRRGRPLFLCALQHPAPVGQICRSFVIVRAPARARVYRANVCLPSFVEALTR